MRWHSRRRDLAAKRLAQTVDHLGPLSRAEGGGWARGQDKVVVQVDDESIRGRGKETAAFGCHPQDVRSRFLDKLLRMTGVYYGNVETAPLVHAYTETDGLGGHGEDGGIVADEDDPSGRRQGRLDDANDVGYGEAGEQRPHGKVLEARRRQGELITERIILHVDPDQVVQPRGREAQDA